MVCKKSALRQLKQARTGRCVTPSGEADRGATVESLLRDLALALHATRAIRRAMETGRTPCLAEG